MDHKTKHRVHTLLHPELGNTHWDRALNAFIILLILLNVIAVMLETIPAIYLPNQAFFHYFDVISVAIFSIEYILRVWSCVHEEKYRHPLYGRLRYMASPGAIIDLLAILPFYLHVFVGLDLRILRILRLFRFLRLFRLTSYMKATKLIVNVFRSVYNQLLLSLVLAITLIIISSSLVYFPEHIAQPDVFTSIPATVWWSVITLTTVGYGDMIPITITGKIFTGVILLAGVAMFALPAGIITAGFLEEIRKQKKSGRQQICPHCHKPIDVEEHANHS
ncbi:MAG: ion transporter [Chitinophagaceae bacterium]|jgi:voltage-gated potassium channel|nr:ion transporter [Chitinophagaceae bacterium]